MTTILLFIKMVVALGLVLGLVFVLSRVTRHVQSGRLRMGAGRIAKAPLDVCARKSISRTSSIVLVRAGERYLLVGVTAQSINLLSEVASDEIEITPEPTSDAPWTASSVTNALAWDATISKLRERTVRH